MGPAGLQQGLGQLQRVGNHHVVVGQSVDEEQGTLQPRRLHAQVGPGVVLRLDRRIAERRVYPAIDVNASSTRHEELLFDRKQLNQVWKLRRVLNGLADGDNGSGAGLELLIDRLKTFPNNDEFLAEVAKGPSMGA